MSRAFLALHSTSTRVTLPPVTGHVTLLWAVNGFSVPIGIESASFDADHYAFSALACVDVFAGELSLFASPGQIRLFDVLKSLVGRSLAPHAQLELRVTNTSGNAMEVPPCGWVVMFDEYAATTKRLGKEAVE